MTKYLYTVLSLALLLLGADVATAGNPDRQGEAGASQLLMNPWARTAGLHAMNTGSISGVEAMRLNPAGIGRINKTEFNFSHSRYFEGTGISINAAGFAARLKNNAALAVSVMAVDMGDIPFTTDAQPAGTGATFSPAINNIGISYSYIFDNKISVGATARVVSEGTSDVTATAIAFDAGVQYVTGPQDNFKFGISLRNVGSRMTFRGQGLAVPANNPSGSDEYTLTYFQRSQGFELPSMLNIGTGYDVVINDKNTLSIMVNFTANSFAQDQVGGGLEYSFKQVLSLRAAYKYEIGSDNPDFDSIYTGLAAGISFDVPVKRGSDTRIGIDYSYRDTRLWNGTHSLGVRLSL